MAQEFEPQSKGLVDWLSENANRHNQRVDDLEKFSYTGVWIKPTLLNGFAAPSAPKIPVHYRFDAKIDRLRFKGHVNGVGAVSGTVAFIIVPPFRKSYEVSALTDMEVGASTFQVARIVIATNGEVKIYWPAL